MQERRDCPQHPLSRGADAQPRQALLPQSRRLKGGGFSPPNNCSTNSNNSSNISRNSNNRKQHFQRCGTRELTLQQQQQRQQQLLLTKGGEGYARYAAAVSPSQRLLSCKDSWHPHTPNPSKPLSVAQWRDVLGTWRRQIHKWTNLPAELYAQLLLLSVPDQVRLLQELPPSQLDVRQGSSAHVAEAAADTDRETTSAAFKPPGVASASANTSKEAEKIAEAAGFPSLAFRRAQERLADIYGAAGAALVRFQQAEQQQQQQQAEQQQQQQALQGPVDQQRLQQLPLDMRFRLQNVAPTLRGTIPSPSSSFGSSTSSSSSSAQLLLTRQQQQAALLLADGGVLSSDACFSAFCALPRRSTTTKRKRFAQHLGWLARPYSSADMATHARATHAGGRGLLATE
ncbi:putative uncharacterized protein DDB_G0288537 [Cyclospora cayetanensis]|uniref:Histone RNA hairpin-binding protein RNA-binding domain-containing protein n=1 Tax=Cyclospora cayetanensis TaxID=88456 RepID=A0A6P6RTQ3_9EIME|nr:putative uncharacterized protein DDB_G0288537 [Cyclospora cayetanensis]